MAKIAEIELKNVKTFNGWEGTGFSASIYMDGKKIGEVVDSAQGGCYDYSFFEGKENEFMERIKDYYSRNPEIDSSKLWECSVEEFKNIKELPLETFDEMFEANDNFIYKLFILHEDEKIYKKNLKKGYSVMVIFDSYHIKAPHPITKINCYTPKYNYQKEIDEYMEKYPYGFVTVYKSLEDFILN